MLRIQMIFLLLCVGFPSLARAQKNGKSMPLQEAVFRALDKNHNIIIARQQVQISQMAQGAGNAGMLPQIGLNSGLTQSSNDTRQRFISGQEVSQKGAESRNFNAGLALNWTIFDGLRMFATYNRLEDQTEISRYELKTQIENTVSSVVLLYFGLLEQKELIRAQEAAIRVSEERIRIASGKLEAGSSGKLELLQARLDKNAKQSQIELMEQQYIQLQSDLNILLGESPSQSLIITDTVPLNYTIPFDSLRTISFYQNNTLRMMEKNLSLREQELKESRSLYMPQIALNLGYGLNRVQNEVGFLLFNNTVSFSGGITASWILYDGSRIRKLNQASLLQLARQKTAFEQARLQVEGQLMIAYEQMLISKIQVQREKENFALAEEALNIALERLRVGSSTPLELMSVQQAYADAAARLASSRFGLSRSVNNLMLLDGSLVMAD